MDGEAGHFDGSLIIGTAITQHQVRKSERFQESLEKKEGVRFKFKK